MNQQKFKEPTSKQIKAADIITEVIIDTLKNEDGIHAETAIWAASRLAGTFLFRSFGFPDIDSKPGNSVLSDEANIKGPLLMTTLSYGLARMEIEVNEDNLLDEVPEENMPLMEITDMQLLLEPKMIPVAKDLKLTQQQAAHSCALATARIIQNASSVIDSNMGFLIAVNGFVEGTKTMPPALPEKASKPWYNFW